ncbi:MAG: hypothetical protein OXC07_01960 [Kistimonas sp.]|nr:hypothetical protein [Kistimonas sp.]
MLPDLAPAWRRACRALRQQPPLKTHLFCTLSRKSSTDLGKDCDTDFADCCDSLTHLQCQSAEASHDHLAACCDKSSRPRTRNSYTQKEKLNAHRSTQADYSVGTTARVTTSSADRQLPGSWPA